LVAGAHGTSSPLTAPEDPAGTEGCIALEQFADALVPTGTVLWFGDDVDLDTDHDSVPNSYEGVSPPWVEPHCQNLEQTRDNHHAAKDWGSPGKQHKTDNTYDD
jgi:hypothetical protein